MSEHKFFNASNYRQHVAERLALTPPEWVDMPSGKKFYLRRVGTMLSSVLAANMPNALTKQAVDAWEEQGVIDLSDVDQSLGKVSSETVKHGMRELPRLARIIQQSCVIPLLTTADIESVDFTEEWKKAALEGLQQDPEFNPETFDPKDYVFNPNDLDGADSDFLLYKWATGLVGATKLKGGGAVHVDDLSRFRKKLARGSRTGAARQKHRKSA